MGVMAVNTLCCPVLDPPVDGEAGMHIFRWGWSTGTMAVQTDKIQYRVVRITEVLVISIDGILGRSGPFREGIGMAVGTGNVVRFIVRCIQKGRKRVSEQYKNAYYKRNGQEAKSTHFFIS